MDTREATALLIAGPDPTQRFALWMNVSGAGQQMEANPGYYKRLLDSRMSLRTIFTKQIERDLARTFPSEQFFERLETQEALRNILTAYSWRNPNVGYCQGMNCFVGRLFSFGFSEEETFWLLTQVVERYLPLDYYSVMTGVLVDNKVFERLLLSRLPKVLKFLRNREIDTSYFCVQWFVCIFASHFKKEVLVRIWDTFFANGASVLFEVALVLVWLSRKGAADIVEFHELVKFIETHPRSITDAEQVLQLTIKKKFRVNPCLLFPIQDRIRIVVKNELSSNLAQHCAATPSESECVNDDDCKQKSLLTSSFFIFTTETAQLREDYLCDENVPRYFNVETLREQKGPMMLGKKSHRCVLERQHFNSMARLNEETQLTGKLAKTVFDELDFEL